MLKIYSEIEKGVLLHIIHKKSDFINGRLDITPEEEFLQVATLKMPNDTTWRPHRHIPKKVNYTEMITAESFVIINGKVKAILYDLNDEIIVEEDLGAGDIVMTFRGGHNYLILEEDTLIYEFKTGPYFGQEKDKVFIE